MTFHKSSISPDIIVISSVQPFLTSAGEVVLHRHLSHLDNWNVLVGRNPQCLLTRIIHKLKRTKFYKLGNDLSVLFHGCRWDRSYRRWLRSFQLSAKKKVVLTVAHGDGCWAAMRFAKKHDLPLVTIFHDWLPDSLVVHEPFSWLTSQRFQHLYEVSDLALCVSEEMKQLLGTHRNSIVLYPIPSSTKSKTSSFSSNKAKPHQPFHVAYSGNLGEYGEMLERLSKEIKGHPNIRLEVRGNPPNWPEDMKQKMLRAGTLLAFASRPEFNRWLNFSDVLLVTMSFDLAMRRRMETSFPSKLTEFSQFGKPIVIWGPSYCSAVRWAKRNDYAFCVTVNSSREIVLALENLQCSPSLRNYYADKIRMAAKGPFSPAVIQKQFLDSIESLIS